MSGWFHEHEWRTAGHALRCADADCGAWVPLPLTDVGAVAPAELPPRRRKPKPDPTSAEAKPKRRSGSKAAPSGAASNVVPLSRKRT